MNILNVDGATIEVPESDTWLHISKHQAQLMEKYAEIEGITGVPMPFQSKATQLWLKEFLWRAHEELAESGEAASFAIAAMESDWPLVQKEVAHLFEEISDTIHFICECWLLCYSADSVYKNLIETAAHEAYTVTAIDLQYIINPMLEVGMVFRGHYSGDRPCSRLRESFATGLSEIKRFMMTEVSYRLGLVGNVLKNKRWKQTEIISDEEEFQFRLEQATTHLMYLLVCCGFRPADIFVLYRKKNLVNKWRQDTGY